MVNIGIVGLDTSHAEAFPEAMNAIDTTSIPGVADDARFSITGVYDDERVRDEAYIERYCSKYNASRYHSIESMVQVVDMAIILSVDWNRHVPLVVPFLEAGIPSFIDKPITGSYTDLQTLDRVTADTPIFGGSAVPFHPAFTSLPRNRPERTTHVVGYNDYFYYRVHPTDTLRHLAKSNWQSVEPVTHIDQTVVEVTFEDGAWGTLRFDGPTDEPVFGAIDVSDRVRTRSVDASMESLQEMYQPFLREFLSIHGNGYEDHTGRVLDSAMLSLAIEIAIDSGQVIKPGDQKLRSAKIESDEFLSDYEPYY